MKHTLLETATLSHAAQRALGPGPGRTMAARGMMPLPPSDQVAVFQLPSLESGTLVLAVDELAQSFVSSCR